MKKIIYTQRVEVIESYNERRDCADQRIAEYIRASGFLPLPVPNNAELIKEIVEEVKPDGIILVGGNSLVKYGGNAPERDAADCALIQIAIEKKIPLYGFCRGMQSILDFFGNDLVKIKGHVAVRHMVNGTEEAVDVNSYHNEACVTLHGDDFVVVMHAEDGVIEKIKHKTLPIVGTMWHPEREWPFRELDKQLLINLVGGKE